MPKKDGFLARLWRKFTGNEHADEDWIVIGADYNQLMLWREEPDSLIAEEVRRFAYEEEERRLAHKREEERKAQQLENQRIAREDEKQWIAHQRQQKRDKRQREKRRIARRRKDHRIKKRQEKQRVARQPEEQHLARQREEDKWEMRQAQQAQEQLQTEGAAYLSSIPGRDRFDELIAIDNRIGQLRHSKLVVEKELRLAERDAAMARLRVQELDGSEDPVNQTYWTHAQVGRDGYQYF